MAETELFPEIFQVRRRLLSMAVRIFRIPFMLLFVLLPSFHVLVFLVFQGLTVHVLGHRESRLCFFFALASQQKEVNTSPETRSSAIVCLGGPYSRLAGYLRNGPTGTEEVCFIGDQKRPRAG